MKLKKFYKLTWIKLILFILITGIPLFFILQQAGIKDGLTVSPAWIYLAYILFWPFFLIYFLEYLIIPNMDWIHLIDIPFVVTALVINVFYIYTIVSLINFIFRKVKSKK